MPTKCPKCKKNSYVMHMTVCEGLVCDLCYDKDRDRYRKECKEMRKRLGRSK